MQISFWILVVSAVEEPRGGPHSSAPPLTWAGTSLWVLLMCSLWMPCSSSVGQWGKWHVNKKLWKDLHVLIAWELRSQSSGNVITEFLKSTKIYLFPSIYQTLSSLNSRGGWEREGRGGHVSLPADLDDGWDSRLRWTVVPDPRLTTVAPLPQVIPVSWPVSLFGNLHEIWSLEKRV